MWFPNEQRFSSQCQSFLVSQNAVDVAHDVNHIHRVVKAAKQLTQEEGADWGIVMPAAWLHDCVSLPKNHPDRAFASTMAADKAIGFLESIEYPSAHHEAIHHAICAHSFSANIPPKTLEAKIVQDADRLDALGAIGIARCMQVSGALNRALYASQDPFCEVREPNDSAYSIDHFYSKLFGIAETLNLPSARHEGERRVAFMRDFLEHLAQEI
ncbi:uncharacterized protein DFP75_11110 [Marinomonas alcarazii]|uniref:HD domain-containing protein n=1 Tax=Marinomonas alcarazii TaxID=491949 RepID=A0A318US53_9GAMM|nr:HD domain-containing protein [Marinomonas alcarazii]PYF78591.1 uncharacterized protein DFP75_11110 [Marinomonas alcarazii]